MIRPAALRHRLPSPRTLLPLVLLLNGLLMLAQAQRFTEIRQLWEDHWLKRAALERFDCD